MPNLIERLEGHKKRLRKAMGMKARIKTPKEAARVAKKFKKSAKKHARIAIARRAVGRAAEKLQKLLGVDKKKRINT